MTWIYWRFAFLAVFYWIRYNFRGVREYRFTFLRDFMWELDERKWYEILISYSILDQYGDILLWLVCCLRAAGMK